MRDVDAALSIRSSIRRPTGLSASAVTTAVRSPKQRRRPRATLYSPPPSQTRERARRRDAPLARIEAQHHLAERDDVETAFLRRPQRESATSLRASTTLATASRVAARSAEAPPPSSAARRSSPPARRHLRQREIGREVVRIDPAGRHEPDVAGNGASAFRNAGPPSDRCREDLELPAPERTRVLDLGRRRDTREERQPYVGAASSDAVVRPRARRRSARRHPARGASCSGDRTVPRADEQTIDAGGAANRLGRRIRAKRDLDDRQPACEQRRDSAFGLVARPSR